MRDGTTGEQVVAWQRGKTGRWSRDPEVVARASDAYRCEDTGFGTFVVGSDSGAAVMWSRLEPGERWERRAFAVGGALRPVLYDVTRDGRSVLLSGSGTGRGQLDLAIWRVDARTTVSVGGADAVFTAPGAQGGLGIVGYKDRIVVVGRSGAGDAAIWVGRDRIPAGELPSG